MATAHPRVCGENPTFVRPSAVRVGSSPRVRGKLPGPVQRDRQRRLIPACAGKTALIRSAAPDHWAHPRVCGENMAKH